MDVLDGSFPWLACLIFLAPVVVTGVALLVLRVRPTPTPDEGEPDA